MFIETENIEFKSEITGDLYKEVIAFANTDGGTIYIGIDNNGNAVGIDDIDDAYTRITNGIRDAIRPDVTMFIKYKLQDHHVVKITVGEGTDKPYYLQAKGLKPSGVYIRQGTSSVQASFEQIRQMIKTSDGDVFENMRSVHQQLTFFAVEAAFKKYHMEFTENKYPLLGIIDPAHSLYTNLAYLISDQCTHTVKIAVFGDDANTQFRDNKEFGGSIFQQLEDAFAYLTLCNKTTVTFQGLERLEKSDYPAEAIREALLNAVVHRDYSYSGSIIINVNENEIEFISIGGLINGLSLEDIRNGISQPRNHKLAEIFHRLRLIEAYGTGIRKIYRLYAECPAQPQIIVTPNTFKLILPNMNRQSVKKVKFHSVLQVSDQMQKILDFIDENNQISDQEVQKLLNIKSTRSYIIMKQMVDEGYLLMIGRGQHKKYIRNNKNRI